MPPAHAQSNASLGSLAREVTRTHSESGLHERVVESEGHGVPMTEAVLEAMNAFATAGAFATLLVVAAVTLAWRGTVLNSSTWGALGAAALASAMGLFLHGRAKLLATFEAACTDAGVPAHDARRRARAALYDSLPRRR
jgi:hypothetical protein